MTSIRVGSSWVSSETTTDSEVAGGLSKLTLTAPDWGNGYFDQFPLHGRLGDPTYWPYWTFGQYDMRDTEIAKDVAAGFNGHYGLNDPDTVNMPGLEAAGMNVLLDPSWPYAADVASPAVVGYRLGDEADMTHGAGLDGWDGVWDWNHCIPIQDQGGKCGYTAMRMKNEEAPPDRLRMTNYSKGVCVWLSRSDASLFVNGFPGISYTPGSPGGFVDMMSADIYWLVDPDVRDISQGGVMLGYGRQLTPEEARRPYNYSRSIGIVRDVDIMDGRRVPIWGQIEMAWWRNVAPALGGYPDYGVNAAEMRAAFWQSIMGGCYGVVNFTFNFNGIAGTGPADQHVQRSTDPFYAGVVAMSTRLGAESTTLAPVLNAPFVTSGWTISAGANAMVKWSGGKFYVWIGNKDSTSKTATFSMPAIGSASAVRLAGETGSVSVSGGSFSDTLVDQNAIHIYRIDGGGTGGL